MCDICRQTPCHDQCPNCEIRKIGDCENCGKEIYEGHELWADYDNNLFCSEKCAEEYHGIKEIDY